MGILNEIVKSLRTISKLSNKKVNKFTSVRKRIKSNESTDKALEALTAAKDRMLYIQDNDPYFVPLKAPIERDGAYGKETLYGSRNANPWLLAMAEDMKHRISEYGYDMELLMPLNDEGFTTLFKPGTYVEKLASRPIDLVVSKDIPENITGYRQTKDGKTVVRVRSDTEGLDLLNTQVHESLMHGTDELMEKLGKIKGTDSTIPEFYLAISEMVNKLPSKYANNSDKWYELRATLGELRSRMYKAIAKTKGKEFYSNAVITPELRTEFENRVDKIKVNTLSSALLGINGYGQDYASVLNNASAKELEILLESFKDLIKYAPVTVTTVSTLLTPYLNSQNNNEL